MCKFKKWKINKIDNIKGVIKCKKNNKERVRVDIAKLPKIYSKINKPKGRTDNNEKITIAAQ